MGTTFKGRLWKTVEGRVRFEVCPAFSVGAEPAEQRQGLQQHEQHVWGSAWSPPGISWPHWTPGQGLPHCWAQADTGKHTWNHVWELAQRVFPSTGNQGEVSGLKQRVNTLNLLIPLHVCLSMCVCTGFCQRQKEMLPVYVHTPHLRLRHSPDFFFSRQVFHELQ